jgi:acid phosphatase family membrane protein YuiD
VRFVLVCLLPAQRVASAQGALTGGRRPASHQSSVAAATWKEADGQVSNAMLLSTMLALIWFADH